MNISTSFQPVGSVALHGKLPRLLPPFLAVWCGQTEAKAAFADDKLLVALFCILRCVRLKLESKKTRKKKNAAVYLYQADNDGEWGEIHFDFEHGKAEIVRLADWDTMRTNIYAKMVIRYVMKCKNGDLPKEIMLGFER